MKKALWGAMLEPAFLVVELDAGPEPVGVLVETISPEPVVKEPDVPVEDEAGPV